MSTHNAGKARSTNPFDWSDSEKDDGASVDKFFDCNERELTAATTRKATDGDVTSKRKAPLNFDFGYAFDSGKNNQMILPSYLMRFWCQKYLH